MVQSWRKIHNANQYLVKQKEFMKDEKEGLTKRWLILGYLSTAVESMMSCIFLIFLCPQPVNDFSSWFLISSSLWLSHYYFSLGSWSETIFFSSKELTCSRAKRKKKSPSLRYSPWAHLFLRSRRISVVSKPSGHYPLEERKKKTKDCLDWMQRLSRSLIRFETQDIKTQPLFNHNFSLDFFPFNNWLNRL